MSDNANEDPGRARNAPNKRAHPARQQGKELHAPARSDVTYRHEHE